MAIKKLIIKKEVNEIMKFLSDSDRKKEIISDYLKAHSNIQNIEEDIGIKFSKPLNLSLNSKH